MNQVRSRKRDAQSVPSAAAVLVLGMHRSGTSAVAGALHLRGFALGNDLMKAGADNPKGFWEHNGIVAVHDRILDSLGRSWDDPRPLPDDWLSHRIVKSEAKRLEKLLRDEFAEATRWAVKDPRLSLLLPLWLPMLGRLGVRASALLVVRHPTEVADSLRVRNELPPGLSRLLWLQHLFAAEEGSRTLPRALLAYEDLLKGKYRSIEAALLSLDIRLPALRPQRRQAMERFISRSDRHHLTDPLTASSRLLPEIVYDSIRHSPQPWVAVAESGRDFRHAESVYRDAMDGYSAMMARAGERFRAAETERDERSKWALRLDGELKQLQNRYEKVVADHESAVKWAQGLDKQLAQAGAELDQTHVAHGEAVKWAKEKEAELQSLREQHATTVADHESAVKWAKGLDKQLVEAGVALKQTQAAHAEAVKWAQAQEAELQSLHTKHAATVSDHENAVQWAKGLDRQLAEANVVLKQAHAAQGEAVKWARAHETELQSLRNEHATTVADHEKAVQRANELDEQLAQVGAELDQTQAAQSEAVRWAKALEAELQSLREQHAATVADRESAVKWAEGLGGKLEAANLQMAQVQASHAEALAKIDKLDGELETSRSEKRMLQDELAYAIDWVERMVAEISAPALPSPNEAGNEVDARQAISGAGRTRNGAGNGI